MCIEYHVFIWFYLSDKYCYFLFSFVTFQNGNARGMRSGTQLHEGRIRKLQEWNPDAFDKVMGVCDDCILLPAVLIIMLTLDFEDRNLSGVRSRILTLVPWTSWQNIEKEIWDWKDDQQTPPISFWLSEAVICWCCLEALPAQPLRLGWDSWNYVMEL